MEDKLQWKTTSKMKNWNFSAITGLTSPNLKLRLRGASQMFLKLNMKTTSNGRIPWKMAAKMKSRNNSETSGLNLS